MWREKNYANRFDLDWQHVADFDRVERIDANEVSEKEFTERFETLYKPVVITGATDHWQAKQKWTLEVCITNFN